MPSEPWFLFKGISHTLKTTYCYDLFHPSTFHNFHSFLLLSPALVKPSAD